jgi:hypothetical protein
MLPPWMSLLALIEMSPPRPAAAAGGRRHRRVLAAGAAGASVRARSRVRLAQPPIGLCTLALERDYRFA